MKLAYFITAHDETTSLDALLNKLKYAEAVDHILVQLDNPTPETEAIVSKWDVHTMYHDLAKDYSTHKNYPAKFFQDEKFSHVFQIDADELPSDFLVSAELKEMLQDNADTELFWIPRCNDYVGVTPEIAAQWGWNINNDHKWVNWHSGDYQGRIYKPHLRWDGKLHERIVGNKTYAFLPKEEQFALYHRKPISKQIATNIKYNQDFTEQENKGHNLI